MNDPWGPFLGSLVLGFWFKDPVNSHGHVSYTNHNFLGQA